MRGSRIALGAIAASLGAGFIAIAVLGNPPSDSPNLEDQAVAGSSTPAVPATGESSVSSSVPPSVTTTTLPLVTATTAPEDRYGAGVEGAALGVPADAVIVTPETLESQINHLPAGTNFALQPGIYRLGSLPNKPNNGYYGDPTDHGLVVFDGETTYNGRRPTSGLMRIFDLDDGNVVANLTVRGYRGDDSKGSAPLSGTGSGVVIRNVEVFANQYVGVRFGGSDWDVSYVTSRHNGQYCYAGTGTGHRLSYFVALECGNKNMAVPRYPLGDRGGSKFVQTSGFTVDHGEVANMDDNGIWFDIGNRDVVIRNLWVHGVDQHGISIEASFGPVLVELNLIEDSASEIIRGAPYRRACIFFSVTKDVTIRDNALRGCGNGIIGYQWNHPQFLGAISGRVQATPLLGARVHDNTISDIDRHTAGIASLTALAGCDADAPCGDNQFFDNDYRDSLAFWWAGTSQDLSTWTELGNS